MSRRVLFVTGEPGLTAALGRLLGPGGRDWEMISYPSGPKAFDAMAEQAADVFVADTRLASSEEWLAEVRRRYPQTVRIVLADAQNRLELVRLSNFVHRVIVRPCSPADLLEAIQRAVSLQEFLRSPSLAAIVGRLGSVPSLPALYTRIIAELERPDFSLETIGELVSQDVGIAAKLLQMSNSALMGLRRPTTTPSQAVYILGAELTKALVLAAGIFSRYDPAAIRPFSIEALWDHSQKVADLAGRIAAEQGAGDMVVREAALAGLFHDIGQLTLASQIPGPYREVLSLVRNDKIPVAEAEQRILGATHAEIGAYLLGLWGIPDRVVEAVAWHHTPAKCPGESFTPLTAVHVADALVRPDDAANLDMSYLMRLKLEDRVGVWARLVGSPRTV
jgi:putative nucleotidyltransferase with HDIG domain